MLVAETPSNPGLELIDIEAAANLAHENGAILNLDNSFATPLLQRPAQLGADLVTHSATKLIDGQGRCLGGAVLGTDDLIEEIRFFTRQTGPGLSAFNAWLLSKSIETLSVRLDRHCENAEALASAVEANGAVSWTRYPFLESHPQVALAHRQMRRGGGMVCFEVKGGQDRAMGFMNRLQMVGRSPNLGDSRSIATHPASTTHSKLSEEERQRVGITQGTIRISVGLEHPDDIVGDIEQALG
jgi:O-succinylhomoserine sulfhydrylase